MRLLYFSLILSVASGSAELWGQSSESGTIAVCSDQYQGRPTASGEVHDPAALTAAHATLPFGSILRVANFETGRMVDVRVNDRKASDGHIVHLSRAAASKIGLDFNAVAPGSSMVIGQMTGVQPVARTGPRNPFEGKDFGSMFRPSEPGADPQPRKFKSSTGPGQSLAINNAVAGSRQDPAQQKGGGLREFFSRFGNSNKGEIVNPNTPPVAAYPPPPLGAPNSPSAGHLIPMNATSPSPPANNPSANTAAATQTPETNNYPYRAQFGAFSADANAREMANGLNAAGVGATVLRSPSTGLFLVVTGGGFRTAEEAQQWINTEAVRRNWQDRPLVVR